MWEAVFFLSFFVLLTIPYVPALLEIRNRKDAAPLPIRQSLSGEVQYFARQFMVLRQREQALAFVADDYQVLGKEAIYKPTMSEIRTSHVHQSISAEGDLVLPDGIAYSREVSARGNLKTGRHASYYSLLSENDLIIQSDSVVKRWAHGRRVQVDKGVVIKSRLSADQEVVVHPEAQFGKLHAPLIRFLEPASVLSHQHDSRTESEISSLRNPFLLQNTSRWIVNSDLHIPDMSLVNADLIVRGDLLVGRGSKIIGSIKTYGELNLESGVQVMGSIISQHNIHISRACRVLGPVVAEGNVKVEGETVIGTVHGPTTVSANRLIAGGGVIAHGSICVIAIINGR